MSIYTSALKRVLVATDLSSHSDRAIERALQLAAAHQAELEIVHVMEEGLPPEAEVLLKETNESTIREKLTGSPFLEQVNVTIDMVIGNADTDIVERAVMSNADCIVLGLHDRLLVENLAIQGTLAETVIKHSKVPVLLVKGDPGAPYRTAIVGVDLSPLSHAAVQAAVLIAPEASLHLVHAYAPDSLSVENTPADIERKLEGFVSKESPVFKRAATVSGLPEIAVKTIAGEGDPRQVLTYEINKRGADLLVLGTHARTGLTRTLLGSVTTDLINERLCDVLVIRSE